MHHVAVLKWMRMFVLAGVLGGAAAGGVSAQAPAQMPTQMPTQMPAQPGPSAAPRQPAPVLPQQSPETATLPASFRALAHDKLPAVVNISTTQKVAQDQGLQMPELPPGMPFRDFFDEFFGERGGRPPVRPPREMQALGSGFIIDPAGLVVTNNHVVAEAASIKVILHDDTELDAKLIGRDPRTDLALLKVENSKPLTAVQWGNSEEAQVGDWVLAIGNPFGLGGTVTAGIISARARDIQAGPYDDFIQTDASINRGNSGGPLFDMKGQVIGINTAIFSPSGGSIGIGFAVPAAVAQPIIQSLRETGTVRRGWLGVAIQRMTDEIAHTLGLPDARGALVTEVAPDGPAAMAGIQSGDVVLEFNNQPIDDMRQLQRTVARTEVDARVPVVVWRDGKRETLNAQIALLRDEPQQVGAHENGQTQKPQDNATHALGLALSELTPERREQLKLPPEARGALVTGVAGDSPAARQGISEGDIITKVGRKDVAGPQDVVAAIEQARKNRQQNVLILRERDGNAIYVPVPLEQRPG